MTLEWDFAAVQIIGEREKQEDYCRFYCEDGKLLAVLADGMGGHASGEVAARLAVNTFVSLASEAGFPWSNCFFNALNESNKSLGDAVRREPALEGMGCTLIGAEIADETIRWISVGDSRLFHLFDGNLRRINADHSMAAQLEAMVQSGDVSEEEARNSPSRHMLLSAVTGDQISRVDVNARGLPVVAGDIILVASDGIDTLNMMELEALLRKYAAWNAADLGRSIISAVVKHGRQNQDNITVMVIRAIQSSTQETPQSRQ